MLIQPTVMPFIPEEAWKLHEQATEKVFMGIDDSPYFISWSEHGCTIDYIDIKKGLSSSVIFPNGKRAFFADRSLAIMYIRTQLLI